MSDSARPPQTSSGGARPYWTRACGSLAVLVCLWAAFEGSSHSQITGEHGQTVELDDSPRVDPHFAEKIRQAARKEQEKFRSRISISDAVGDDVPTAADARRAFRRPGAPPTTQPPTNWLEANLPMWLSLVAGVLTVTLLVRKFAPGLVPWLSERFNPWVTGLAPSTESSSHVRAEDESFSEFLTTFQTGPGSEFVGDESVRAEAVKAFYEKSTRTLDTLHKMLQEVDRTTDEGGRQKILDALRWEMHALRSEASVPELLLVWQMAYAVESLLKQLTDNAANVTPSTLRTLAGGVELLDELRHPGIQADLLTRRPLQFLTVDDDPISRKAVAFALKRALNEPELAADGESALELASQRAYDVIFVDVEMPGMDGFEVCSALHRTEANRYTPVVFVTGHSDFEARTKAVVSGGSDLIGKPFLTFEITVKALTLALRGRLTVSAQSDAAEHAALAHATATDSAQASASLANGTDESAPPADPQELATQFLTRASAQLAPLREAFQAIFCAPNEAARQELLADVFLRIHSLTPKDKLPAVHPAIQLSAALDGLLRKLLQNPANAGGSALVTLVAAVELLDDLCALQADAELTSPPIRILVVDDDPVARRVLTGALQTAFGKPDCADSGEAALALVNDRPYEVIFLDVHMPGLDGFEVCSRIRQAGANQTTPVVFVSSYTNGKLRAQIADCGGTAFVAKPFLVAEITLKALTFALRGWLEKTEHPEEVPQLA